MRKQYWSHEDVVDWSTETRLINRYDTASTQTSSFPASLQHHIKHEGRLHSDFSLGTFVPGWDGTNLGYSQSHQEQECICI